MYGTVARMQLKPGMEQRLKDQMSEFESAGVPGAVAVYGYRMDAEPDVYYMAVVFDDKETYFANANSSAQNARYRRMRELLVADPEWHDGEIVWQQSGSTRR